MTDTKLIMLEGLPATGKTTNSQFLQIQLQRNGIKTEWIHEVTRPNPVLFFNEAGFTYDEYGVFLKNHQESAHILNNIALFRKSTVGIDLLEVKWNYMNGLKENVYQELQEFDTFKFSLEKYKKFALEKWTHFTEEALKNKDQIYILDSAIFQYQIFTFLFKNAPYADLENFIHKLFDIIEPLNPCLIYFYREDTEATIDYLEKDRGVQDLINTWERDKSQLYYQDKPKGAEGVKQFLRDYACLAKLLFNSAPCKKVSLEISKGDWPSYENEMLAFLGIKRIPNPDFVPQSGIYKNEELKFEIKVDGLKIKDPAGKVRKLIPKSQNEFYTEGLPVVLKFAESDKIMISGLQISERWTASGTVYKKI